MYIKEIVIDGFKSYANRTVVGGWDPRFNAITGLNGSGKSNILDSICFVLGISNLTHVRAQSLRDLVYKQGQGRVTKASVSIIFDNADKSQSPVGYEHFDEITVTREVAVGGRNKYLINGQVAQLQRVQNLFHSVQLNVNNPHFLIMQGRITKVLNMKPPEILAMIEETAGTRMFELKKQSALKTILKKQQKVDEINKVLIEEITPQLEKLRKDSQLYRLWSSNNSEIDRFEKYCVAFVFHEKQTIAKGGSQEMQSMTQSMENLESDLEKHIDEISRLDASINELSTEKESSSFYALEKNVTHLSKELVKRKSVFESIEKSLASELSSQNEIAKQLEECRKELEKRTSHAQALEKIYSETRIQYEKKLAEKERIEGEQLGFDMNSTKDGDKCKGNLMEQLMETEKNLGLLKTKKTSFEDQIRSCDDEIKQRKKELSALSKEFKALYEKRNSISGVIQSIKNKQESLSFDVDSFSSLSVNVKEKEKSVLVLKRKIDEMLSGLSGIEFHHESKKSGGKVYGRVARLVSVKNLKYSTALEVCAGGRLFNIVVDSDVTGQEILKNGHKLANRITMIPLNKIKGRKIAPRVVSIAQSLVGSENVCPAIDHTDFEEDLEAAMNFVFGGSFVCETSDQGKQIAFHPDIRTRTVTVEGDVFDPSGTLTGGSRSAKSSILARVLELRQAEIFYEKEKNDLVSMQTQMDSLTRTNAENQSLVEELELNIHKLKVLDETLSKTEYRQQELKLQELEKTKSQFLASLNTTDASLQETNALLTDLRKQIAMKDKDRTSGSSDISHRIEKIKSELVELHEKSLKHKGAVEKALVDVDVMAEEVNSLVSQSESILQKIKELEEILAIEKKNLGESQSAHDAAEQKLLKEKEQLLSTDSQLSSMVKKRESLTKRQSHLQLEIKRLEGKMSRFEKEKDEARQEVSALLKKYPWIQSESHLFGKPHTDYDFRKLSFNDAQNLLLKKKEEQVSLSKKLNKKALGMAQKAEEEYQNLMKRKSTIENDKSKIEQVIEELDHKKTEALYQTWEKVNRDFGSIFSTLLPGTAAKLDPPEGGTVMDGLEVKVAFGNVWKQSLSELSGGQRSLLALSLILSLLLYKPAPMYILDEIDAALDLSHTQNIGRMLKTHFAKSQFIIVSLKEGMFNNANVLFRTKFVDGVSTVSRTTHSSD